MCAYDLFVFFKFIFIDFLQKKKKKRILRYRHWKTIDCNKQCCFTYVITFPNNNLLTNAYYFAYLTVLSSFYLIFLNNMI